LIAAPGTQRRAGGPGASSALSACGVSQDLFFPQESRAFRHNQQSVQNQQLALTQPFFKQIDYDHKYSQSRQN
jgi:hypothetical protein